ncbi:MAG: DUF1553 domain-containing protein [Planctomycetota bacterium]
MNGADHLIEHDDDRLSELLRDAYGDTPVPMSLKQRLDAGIEAEFGIPLAEKRYGEGAWRKRVFELSQPLARVWQAAAAVLLVVCTWFLIREGNVAYGFQQVMEALQRAQADVMEIERRDASGRSKRHWVSISRGLIGESTDDQIRIWDHRRGVVTFRRGDRVRRARFREGTLDLDPKRMLLAVMLGRGGDLTAMDDVSIVDLGWSESPQGVRVRMRAAVDGTTKPLEIWVDESTGLPKSVHADGQQSTVSYPGRTVQQWLSESIPNELAIEEVALDRMDFIDDSPVAVESTLSTDVASAAMPPTKPAPSKVSVIGAASLGWRAVAKPGMNEAAFVDGVNVLLSRLWRDNGVQPTRVATDEELVRRVYLDLVGRTPTVSELRDYANDPSNHRYEQLVDRLLTSRDHATHVAAAWRAFLLPEGVDLTRFGGTESFDTWMAERLLEGVGYDQLVRELLLADGRLTNSGPLLFYAASKLDADKLAARSARVFLGMRLECAQCHDDPFEPYTQDDFWGYAAFFARISRPQAALETVSTVMRVHDVDRGEVKYPDTDVVVEPKFLDHAEVDSSADAPSRRQQLAAWMTDDSNPFFARATANRVWAHMFGRGIVNPVDGFGEMNSPQSDALLDMVAGHLIENGFDLRALFRGLALSDAYRLSSGADTIDPMRQAWFAQMNIKMLTAEQIFDCITVASMMGTVVDDGFDLARVGNQTRGDFIALFKTPAGKTNRYHGGIPQALTLMNGGLIQNATGLSTSGLLKTLDAPFLSDDQRIEILYQATLSRKPRPSEWSRLRTFVADSESSKEAHADILWTLLNSAEFTMNH